MVGKHRCQEIVERLSAGDMESLRDSAFAAGDESCREAIPALTELLRSEHLGVQEAAELALKKLGGSRTIHFLTPLLRSESPPVRNVAVDILRDISDQDLDSIVDLLFDDDTDVRIFAADILGHAGSIMVVSPLCNSLLKDTDPNVRYQAAVSLGQLAYHEASSCLKKALDDEEWVQFAVIEALKKIRDESSLVALTSTLGQKSELVDSMIIEALGETGSFKAVPLLLNKLDQADVPLRNKIIQALVGILGERTQSLLTKLSRETFFEYLLTALEDEDPDIQDAAVQGLEYFGGQSASRKILGFACHLDEEIEPDRLSGAIGALQRIGFNEALEEAVRSEDETLAARAIAVLTKLDSLEARRLLMEIFWAMDRDAQRQISQALRFRSGPEARDFFQRILEDHSDGTVIKSALLFLGKGLKDVSADRSVLQFLWHRFPDVREAALEACIFLGTDPIIEQLRSMTRSTKTEERLYGFYGLGQMPGIERTDVLRQGLYDEEAEVRRAALEALAASCDDDPSIISEISDFLGDESRDVRLAVVSSLAQLPAGQAVPLLEPALEDEDDWVRIRALEGLVRLGYEGSLPMIAKLLESENTLLQIKAIEALSSIGGEDAFQMLLSLLDVEDAEVRAAAENALFKIR